MSEEATHQCLKRGADVGCRYWGRCHTAQREKERETHRARDRERERGEGAGLQLQPCISVCVWVWHPLKSLEVRTHAVSSSSSEWMHAALSNVLWHYKITFKMCPAQRRCFMCKHILNNSLKHVLPVHMSSHYFTRVLLLPSNMFAPLAHTSCLHLNAPCRA